MKQLLSINTSANNTNWTFPFAIFFTIFFCNLPFVAHLQPFSGYKCGVLNINNNQPPTGRYDYTDRFGNYYTANDLSLLGTNLQGGQCGNIPDFTLVFENFQGIYPFSQTEMETICDVFQYLSSIINTQSGQKAIIRLTKNPSLPSTFAAVGTAYFNHQCGVGYSLVQQQLTVGNMPQSEHGFIAINPMVSNFYIGPPGQIGANQVDFYSAVLHEALHVLGFGSQIALDGGPLQGFYTLWDLNLLSPSGQNMILSSPSINSECCANYNLNSQVFNDMPNMIWNQDCGANNIRFDVTQMPPVNAEYGTQDQSTFLNVLSHLDRNCGTEHYVMDAGLHVGIDGVQRVLTHTELSMMCKLGYTITGGCSAQCIAMAHDDGPYYVELGQSIDIALSGPNGILSNDFPNTATFQAILPNCGDQSGISISPLGPNPTVLNIQGTAIGGAYTICYSISSCNGQWCSTGRIYIYVTNPAIETACDNLEDCQTNPFWDFELFGSNGEMLHNLTLGGDQNSQGLPGSGFTFYDSNSFDNTPDLIHGTLTGGYASICNGNGFYNLSPPNGDQAIGMIVRHFNGVNLPEGMAFPLCKPVLPGMSGTISFLATTAEACLSIAPQVRLEFSEQAPVAGQNVYNNPGISSPSWFTQITSSQNSNPIFKPYTVSFTNETNLCWNYLYMSSFVSQDIPFNAYILVDAVRLNLHSSLEDALQVSNTTTPSDPCLGSQIQVAIQICNPDACNGQIIVNPGMSIAPVLPSGLTLLPNSDFPTLNHTINPGEIPSGACIDLMLNLQVASDYNLVGQSLPIDLQFNSLDPCFEGFTRQIGQISPKSCAQCSCPNANNLNIEVDATDGTLWSVYAAAHNNLPDNLDYTVHHGCISIKGKLIFDRDVRISDCQPLIMNPCAEIEVGNLLAAVPNYPTLQMDNNRVVGCERMWKTIKVNPYCGLVMSENSIEDAEVGITVIPTTSSLSSSTPTFTHIDIQDNYFLRNHIGIRIENPNASFSPIVTHLPFTNNVFDGIAPYYFNGNTTLLPPCDANNKPEGYNEQSGYAGFITKGASFTLGLSGNTGFSNLFRDLRNGAMAENAFINVYRCDFQNIIGYEAPPSTKSLYEATGAGVWASGGGARVEGCRFNQTGTGVTAINSACVVRNNSFPDVQTGVSSYGGTFRTWIEGNLDLHYRDYGLYIYGPKVNTFLNPSVMISNNHLFTLGTDNDIDKEAGIFLASPIGPSIPIGATMPKLIRIQYNDLYSTKLTDGIRMQNASNCILDQNHVFLQNDLLGNAQNSQGIILQNSGNNWLYGNTVENQSTVPDDISRGFDIALSPQNTFCCNTTTNTNVGIFFTGTCSQTILRNQNMSGHEMALGCTGVISDQPNLTDYPDGNNSNFFNAGSGQARHFGSLAAIKDSRFPVKTDLQPDWPESIIPDNPDHYDQSGWFRISGNETKECQNSSECNEPSIRGEDIDNTDIHTLDGSYLDGSLEGNTLTWEGRLYLYARMHDFPNLLQNETLRSFYDGQAESGIVKGFYEVEDALNKLFLLSVTEQMTLRNAYNDAWYQDSMTQVALSRLQTVHTAADSAAIRMAANQYQQGAAFHFHELQDAWNQVELLRGVRAQQALVRVQVLPQADMLQSNRKTVFRIYLETVGQGIAHLNPDQFNTISAIAHQCPEEGGSSIYIARSLYALNESKSFQDEANCLKESNRSVDVGESPDAGEVKIRPNPAGDRVTISLLGNPKTEEPSMLEISDMDGRVICLVPLVNQGDTTVNTAPFPAGLYICRVLGAKSVSQPYKLVIQR